MEKNQDPIYQEPKDQDPNVNDPIYQAWKRVGNGTDFDEYERKADIGSQKRGFASARAEHNYYCWLFNMIPIMKQNGFEIVRSGNYKYIFVKSGKAWLKNFEPGAVVQQSDGSFVYDDKTKKLMKKLCDKGYRLKVGPAVPISEQQSDSWGLYWENYNLMIDRGRIIDNSVPKVVTEDLGREALKSLDGSVPLDDYEERFNNEIARTFLDRLLGRE